MELLAQIICHLTLSQTTFVCQLSSSLPPLPPVIATLTYKEKIITSQRGCSCHEAASAPILADPSLALALQTSCSIRISHVKSFIRVTSITCETSLQRQWTGSQNTEGPKAFHRSATKQLNCQDTVNSSLLHDCAKNPQGLLPLQNHRQ